MNLVSVETVQRVQQCMARKMAEACGAVNRPASSIGIGAEAPISKLKFKPKILYSWGLSGVEVLYQPLDGFLSLGQCC